MSDYHFVTNWKFKAPIVQVWKIIKNTGEWPEWWPYIQEVKLLQKGDNNDIGSIREITWKTALPYSLSFKTELVALEKYQRIEGRAIGQLEGKGIWTFSEDKGYTLVQYDWIVKTNKPWMNFFAPVARPLFEWNHDKVMAAGYQGLQQRLSKMEAAI